jgi:hypothetical protein
MADKVFLGGSRGFGAKPRRSVSVGIEVGLRSATFAFSALWLSAAGMGCGEQRDTPPVTGAGATGGSAGEGASFGGESGTPGGSGATSRAGETGEAGAGGTPSSEAGAGGQGEAGTGIPPIDEVCAGDRAFVAVSGAFIDPTPRELALGLNAAIFDKEPMSFVLRNHGDMAEVAASYTIVGDGAHSFPPAMVPAFVPAWIAEGGFGSNTAQDLGYLSVEINGLPFELPLTNITFVATTRDQCARGVVTMSGVIPPGNSDLLERISGEATQAATPRDERTTDEEITVSGLFSIEQVAFDFEALP